MGITERKEREKQEMRQRIIDAAMHMFLEDGYNKTSIRNIAEAIEYSPATIYLYYKDKDELLYEVQRQAFDKLFDAFQREATDPDPWTRLTQICKSYVRFGLANEELYDLMFIIRSPMNVDEKIHETNGKDCFGYVTDCLVECIKKGLVRFDNPHIGMLSIWSMGHGLVSLQVRCRLKVLDMAESDVDTLLDHAIETYLSQIKR
ncbi:TetR/AcrR family transcriptional regulator [Dinghuibacter silviterrae]|uniref:TetR family transcriptional regulator n=1 Tax=Dinghuibacter silviterrae TaxID=1539049 RepID=A0A4R8DFU8_9BACT|nr:TetR/AcrR family transcriptional regulator [Dinghuibacter silviterrae]TDW96114.1 TetR family transcriptional regulator [Dinghuibacter silviterrae]